MGKTKGNKKKGAYIWSGDISRITPLQGGYCRVQDDLGKSHHLKRDSDELMELLRHLDDVMDGKITRELTSLGWVEHLEEL